MASLKPRTRVPEAGARAGSPQLIAVASLKQLYSVGGEWFRCGSPQLIAVASLKRERARCAAAEYPSISTANRCGLVEASILMVCSLLNELISTANRCGLVEADSPAIQIPLVLEISTANRCGLVEAASRTPPRIRAYPISTANRCGLVEAGRGIGVEVLVPNGSPQLIAVASLKRSSRYRTSLSATDLHS